MVPRSGRPHTRRFVALLGGDGADTLLLNTLAGDDTVAIGAGVSSLIQTTVDLGPDG